MSSKAHYTFLKYLSNGILWIFVCFRQCQVHSSAALTEFDLMLNMYNFKTQKMVWYTYQQLFNILNEKQRERTLEAY